MSNTKTIETLKDHSLETVQHLGIALMAVATLMGVVEVPEHGNRTPMMMQPSFVFAAEPAENGSTLRREREETGPHYVSFGVSQRTPARSGKA